MDATFSDLLLLASATLLFYQYFRIAAQSRSIKYLAREVAILDRTAHYTGHMASLAVQEVKEGKVPYYSKIFIDLPVPPEFLPVAAKIIELHKSRVSSAQLTNITKV